MSFTKEQIKAAKVGQHVIRWSPWGVDHRVVITKVRGDFVWVRQLDMDGTYSVRLNRTASEMIIKGDYRPQIKACT